MGNTITSGEFVGIQKCELCSGDMAEYPRYRYMCDYVVVTMLPIEAVSTLRPVGQIFRGIRIKLNGKLANNSFVKDKIRLFKNRTNILG